MPRKHSFNSCIPLIFCSRVYQGRQQHTVLEGIVAFAVRFACAFTISCYFAGGFREVRKAEEITAWKSLPLLGSFPRSLYLNIFCFSALDEFTYHGIADETLDALTEFFENIGDEYECHKDYDVNLSVSTELNAVFVHGPLRPYLQKDLTLLLEQELGQS